MKNNFEVIPLFATPLYRTNLGPLDPKLKDFIVNAPCERMPAGNGSYTVDKYILNSPELALLKEKIMSRVRHFLHDFLDVKKTLDYQMENSWVNKHEPNDYSPSHWHGSSVISGVYYVEVGDDMGDIVFHKDHRHMNLFNDLIETKFNYEETLNQDKMNVFNTNNFGIQPLRNDLILFPSHLAHSVDENKTDRTRFCIAFNIFPRGTSGGAINTLTV